MNLLVGNQIRASDVDWRIIPLQFVQNKTLRKRDIIGRRKKIKLMLTHIYIKIRRQKTVQMKQSFRKYTHLLHVYLPTQKVLEDIMETCRN